MTVTLLFTSVKSDQLLLFRVIALVNKKCVRLFSRGEFRLIYEGVPDSAFLTEAFVQSRASLAAVHHAGDHLMLQKWRIRKVIILETAVRFIKAHLRINQFGILCGM